RDTNFLPAPPKFLQRRGPPRKSHENDRAAPSNAVSLRNNPQFREMLLPLSIPCAGHSLRAEVPGSKPRGAPPQLLHTRTSPFRRSITQSLWCPRPAPEKYRLFFKGGKNRAASGHKARRIPGSAPSTARREQ